MQHPHLHIASMVEQTLNKDYHIRVTYADEKSATIFTPGVHQWYVTFSPAQLLYDANRLPAFYHTIRNDLNAWLSEGQQFMVACRQADGFYCAEFIKLPTLRQLSILRVPPLFPPQWYMHQLIATYESLSPTCEIVARAFNHRIRNYRRVTTATALQLFNEVWHEYNL